MSKSSVGVSGRGVEAPRSVRKVLLKLQKVKVPQEKPNIMKLKENFI